MGTGGNWGERGMGTRGTYRNVKENGGNSSRERGAQQGWGGRLFQGEGGASAFGSRLKRKRKRESVVVAVSHRSSYGALLLGLLVAPPPPGIGAACSHGGHHSRATKHSASSYNPRTEPLFFF